MYWGIYLLYLQSQENSGEEEEMEIPRRLTEIIQKGDGLIVF
jgi:hypothetical protein